MKYIYIDRLEGEFAVCEEDNNMVKIKRSSLPEKAKEGDVLKIVECGYEIDEEETKKRKEEIFKLQDDIFSK